MTNRHLRTACAALLGAAAVIAGVAAPVNQARAETQVIADLNRAEVYGLFNTLHNTRDWIGQDLSIKGSRTRTRFRSTRQAPILTARAATKYDAFNQGWVIEVAHEGLFLLKDVSSTGLNSGGASVTVTQRAAGTEFIVQSSYRFTWVPDTKTLLIEDIDGIGRASQSGTYTVAARTSTKIETEQDSSNFSLSGKGGFGFDFSKASSASLSFFDARIRGNPYNIQRGKVNSTRGLGLTRDFTFDLEWASEALMDYQAMLVNKNLTVNSSLTYKFLVTKAQPLPGGEGSTDGMVTSTRMTTSSAATSANTFLGRVFYEANPAILQVGDETRKLGQIARHVISIDDFGSEFTSAQTVAVKSNNQFDLQITGISQPISIELGSRSLGDKSQTVKKFSQPVGVQ